MASTDIQLVQAEPVPEHSAEIKAQIAALDREYERLREMVVTGLASGPLWAGRGQFCDATDGRDCRCAAAIAFRSVRGAGEADKIHEAAEERRGEVAVIVASAGPCTEQPCTEQEQTTSGDLLVA